VSDSAIIRYSRNTAAIYALRASFSMPLDWGRPRIESGPPMREEDAIFRDLSAICTSPGYVHAFPMPSSERFECGDDNLFGYQFRGLKIREEQACSHRIQYADKLLG